MFEVNESTIKVVSLLLRLSLQNKYTFKSDILCLIGRLISIV